MGVLASFRPSNQPIHNLKCVRAEAEGEAMMQEWSGEGNHRELKGACLKCAFPDA